MTPDERLAHARAAVAAAEARGETWQGWTEQERTEVNMGYQREPDPARAHAEAESMRRIAAMPFNRGRTWTSGSALNVETKAMSGDKGSHESVAHGVYRVRWNDADGVSLAAIGSGPGGERWIAPTNWLRPGLLATCWTEIKSLERIDVGGPDEVECSDATARDETNRQLREAQRLLDEEVRTAETWRDRCFKEEKERDAARRDYALERKAHDDTLKALADEKAAHRLATARADDAVRALEEERKARARAEMRLTAASSDVRLATVNHFGEPVRSGAHTGAVSDRARLIYEGAVRLASCDVASGQPCICDEEIESMESIATIYTRGSEGLLRAAEAEAAKGASGEGRA